MLPIAHRTTQINQTLLFLTKKITSGLSSRGQCAILEKSKKEKLYKQAKYTELRAEIKRLYKVKEILQINVVFDFLAGYNKTLKENLKDFTGGKQTAKKVIQQCQKWIFSQNCEIVKYFCNA